MLGGMRRLCILLAGLALAAAGQHAQVVVTAMASSRGGLAPITAAQVEVKQGKHSDPVTAWRPATGANAGMEVAIVVDDDTLALAGPALDDLKAFIRALPPAAGVALVYMHTGTVSIIVPHGREDAVRQLHQPTGASSPSPYGSLMAFLAKWGRRPGVRREIVMISDGEEHAGGNNSSNETFQRAVGDAVLSGVVVYSIFAQGSTPNIAPGIAGAAIGAAQVGMGAFNAPEFDTSAGLQNLSILAKATGGEAYSQGSSTPARLQSFLDEILLRMNAQYLLDFTVAPESHRGLTGLKVEIQDRGAKITAPDKVWAESNR